jgi:hypothetical protein
MSVSTCVQANLTIQPRAEPTHVRVKANGRWYKAPADWLGLWLMRIAIAIACIWISGVKGAGRLVLRDVMLLAGGFLLMVGSTKAILRGRLRPDQASSSRRAAAVRRSSVVNPSPNRP